MAQVKGEFLADFTSFYDAVTKAEVSLDGFERSAAKVESALDRAVNSFSGTKLVQQATIAVEAVKRLGDGVDALSGVTKLTASEQAKLNAQLTEAIAKYDALGKEAPADMVALQKATAQVAEETGKVTKTVAEAGKGGAAQSWVKDFTGQITSMAAGMISAQAVIGAFQAAWAGLVSFVGSSIESFAGAEAAEKRVAIALEGINQATPRATAYMADLASSFQDTTKYSDDLINEMQALLIQVGQVLPADMEGALSAATNLASGLGIDLKQATEAVAKAFAGQSEGLKKFGIDISEAKLQAEGMPYVLDEINKRFGGQAQAELDTYSGKVQHLANTWDNVKESIGKVAIESPIVAAALNALDAAAGKSELGATDAAHGWSNLAKTFSIFGQGNITSDAIRQLEDLSVAYNEARWARDQFEKPPVSENVSSRLGTAQDHARIQATVNAELKAGAQAATDKEAADKKAAQAATSHASAVQGLRDSLSGDGAIKQAQLYIEALVGITDKSKLSAGAHKQIQEALWKAYEAYKAQGKDVPGIIGTLINETYRYGESIKYVNGLTNLPGTPVILSTLKEIQERAKPAADGLTQLYEAWNKPTRPGEAGVPQWMKDQERIAKYIQEFGVGIEAAKKALGIMGDTGKDAMDKTAAATANATNQIVQMNTALGANKSALESVLAGHELMAAYAKSGVAMGNTIATGGWDFSMMQRAGLPTANIARGLVTPGAGYSSQPWGNNNTLNVNVNNADAGNIADKLVSEMKRNGYRF